jgi:hypothetical protein
MEITEAAQLLTERVVAEQERQDRQLVQPVVVTAAMVVKIVLPEQTTTGPVELVVDSILEMHHRYTEVLVAKVVVVDLLVARALKITAAAVH